MNRAPAPALPPDAGLEELCHLLHTTDRGPAHRSGGDVRWSR
jgi:hypothetical protein